jgi:hypothetical protein
MALIRFGGQFSRVAISILSRSGLVSPFVVERLKKAAQALGGGLVRTGGGRWMPSSAPSKFWSDVNLSAIARWATS